MNPIATIAMNLPEEKFQELLVCLETIVREHPTEIPSIMFCGDNLGNDKNRSLIFTLALSMKNILPDGSKEDRNPTMYYRKKLPN